jgi:mono/diheme cytochrome c family protein
VLDPVKGDDVDRQYHSVTLTCAACHVGRVRVAQGRYKLLVGAPNTEIDVRKFRRAVELTVDQYLGAEADVKRTAARVAALVEAKPAGYRFFGGRYGIDSASEDTERVRFQDPAFVATIQADLARRVRGGRAAVEKQLATSYSRPDAPPLDGGSPGQSDGSGDLIPKFLLGREVAHGGEGDPVRRFLATYYPELPYRNATVTDNPSVWRQADRPFGQLDGSIRAPIIRNVAAQTAVVGSARGINVRNADIAARFTAALPPPPYPFAVDLTRARRGEPLFRQHCQACHRAGNGAVYGADAIGTNLNRARVLNVEGKALLLENFRAAIPRDYVATAADGTTYKPAELAPDDIINDRTRPDHQGYVAGPLDGVWARAPYLHNGSVPTLRHLLAPGNPESRRPEAFVRGVVSYDRLNVGFDWAPRLAGALSDEAPTAVVFDTRWDGASNRGHDRDITVDDEGRLDPAGRARRLDWSGPEHRSELEDLLEYLKTL